MWRIPVPGERVVVDGTIVTVLAHYVDGVERRLIVGYKGGIKRSVAMARVEDRVLGRDLEWAT